jgi:hypothetical protein
MKDLQATIDRTMLDDLKARLTLETAEKQKAMEKLE